MKDEEIARLAERLPEWRSTARDVGDVQPRASDCAKLNEGRSEFYYELWLSNGRVKGRCRKAYNHVKAESRNDVQ